jgi:hypothetical protein
MIMQKAILLIFVVAAVLIAGCAGGGGGGGDGAATIKDCGTVSSNIAGDAAYKCFNDSAAKCAPAKLKVDTRYMLATGYSTNVVGYLMYMEIQNGTAQACKFYSRYDDLFMPTGITEEERQNLTASAQRLKGKYMTCTMTTAEITTGEMGLEDTCSKCTGTVIDLLKTMGACPGGNVDVNVTPECTVNTDCASPNCVGGTASCVSGECEAVCPSTIGMTDIFVDADGIWAGQYGPGKIYRLSKDGATATPFADEAGTVLRINADANYVIWTTDTAVRRMKLTGGAPQRMSTTSGIHDSLIDDTHVYWIDGTGIRRVNKEFGDTELIARYPADCPERTCMTQNGGEIYWVAMSAKKVYGVPKALNGSVKTLYAGYSLFNDQGGDINPSAIAADDQYVYFSSDNVYSLLKVPKQGGQITAVAKNQQINDMVVDGGYIYTAGPQIEKIDKSTGAVTVIADASGTATSIRVDGQNVYWLEQGALKKAAK